MNTFRVNTQWRKILIEQGLDPLEVLKRAGISIDVFTNTDVANIDIEDYFRMWGILEKLSKTKDWSLRLMTSRAPNEFNSISFAALCSPNISDALNRLQEYKLLAGPMRINLTEVPNGLTVTTECAYYDKKIPPTFEATELAFLVHLARLGTEDNIVPYEVTLPEALNDPFQNFFGTKAKTSDRMSVTFARTDLKRPFVTRNEHWWKFFEPKLRQNLENLQKTEAIETRVYNALLELLPAGRNSADDVAKKLAISKRTMQRMLSNQGTNYQNVLKNVRLDLATHYLQQSDIPGIEIALLLGYESQSAFIRAFTDWTGVPPTRYGNDNKITNPRIFS